MTIFYQNRACETHKKVIFQRFSPILFYFSDFLAKIVLFVGVNIRAKLGQIRADYGAGEGQGQSPLYIYIYKFPSRFPDCALTHIFTRFSRLEGKREISLFFPNFP